MKFSIKAYAMLWTIVFMAMTMQNSAIAGDNDNVGVRQIAAPSRERGIDLDVTVWYPAQRGGKSVMLGGSVFFLGTSVLRDAPLSDGKFPVILLSHGAGLAGNAEALSWIAMPLAKAGFIVVAPTHPQNTGAHRSPIAMMKLWLRPADITDALTAIEKDSLFQPHIKPRDVGILGLSMGGGTALAIAGARMDPKHLAGYCDTDALNPSLCGWIRQSGVDLHRMDWHLAGRDNADTRIRFAMAIDPAPIDAFEFDSFSRIAIPVDLVNLGQPGKIPVTTLASGISKVIPNARYSTIEDASHFSMFAECRRGASEFADAEKIGDPICKDGGGRSRKDIHTQLINLVITAFSRTLKTDP